MREGPIFNGTNHFYSDHLDFSPFNVSASSEGQFGVENQTFTLFNGTYNDSVPVEEVDFNVSYFNIHPSDVSLCILVTTTRDRGAFL